MSTTATMAPQPTDPPASDDQARRRRLKAQHLERLMAIEPPPMREVTRGWFTITERKIPAPRDPVWDAKRK